MRALLALELSPEPCSLALGFAAAPEAVHERRFAGERGRALLAEIDALCRDAGCARTDLGGVVVGLGPGSYTGLRIACTAARTLGWALGIPVGGIGSFEGAVAASGLTGAVHVVVDAYRGEFYHALAQSEGDDVRLVREPSVHAMEALHEVLAGDAPLLADARMRERLSETSRDSLPAADARVHDYAPDARALLAIARARGVGADGRGFDTLAKAEPLYLRAAAFRPR